KLVVEVFGGFPDWLRESRLFGVEEPVPQLASGDVITCPNSGSAGCNVSWSGGRGFLTAGHVAGSPMASCYSAGVCIGTVVYSNTSSGHGTFPEDDVAVVELQPGVSLGTQLRGPAIAAPNSPVTVLGGPQFATITHIRAYLAWLYSPQMGGTWGDVYMTMS